MFYIIILYVFHFILFYNIDSHNYCSVESDKNNEFVFNQIKKAVERDAVPCTLPPIFEVFILLNKHWYIVNLKLFFF